MALTEGSSDASGPDRYVCPDHGKDLTDAVREQLEDQVDAVYGRHRIRLGSRPAREPFRVLVPCPGDGPETRHKQRCVGEYWT